MKLNKVSLFDANNIAHANHAGNVLTVGIVQVQAIYGFLRSIQASIRNGATSPIVLWDGRAQFRYDLLPEYKGNRGADTHEDEVAVQAFRMQIPVIHKMLESLGVAQVFTNDYEADDLAGHFSRLFSQKGDVTLVSGDKDWISLINNRVTWFDPIRNRIATPATIHANFGFSDPIAFLHGKALIGDTSDNIDGLPGFGKKTASEFMEVWGDVNEFFARVDAGTAAPKERASKASKTLHPEQILVSPEGRALFARNVELMRLDRVIPKSAYTVARKPLDEERFLNICQKLNFASVLRNYEGFMKPIRAISYK